MTEYFLCKANPLLQKTKHINKELINFKMIKFQ